jgi:hypothetical protein
MQLDIVPAAIFPQNVGQPKFLKATFHHILVLNRTGEKSSSPARQRYCSAQNTFTQAFGGAQACT